MNGLTPQRPKKPKVGKPAVKKPSGKGLSALKPPKLRTKKNPIPRLNSLLK